MYYKNLTINGTEFKLAVNITGDGAPTEYTDGDVGMLYMDESNGELYKCTSKHTWKKMKLSEETFTESEKVAARANIGAWGDEKSVLLESLGAKMTESATILEKRIENLEAAVSPGLVTPTVDDSVAYIKNVPTGALPNAMISEIGGMTRKCTNLLPKHTKTTTTSGGVTCTINEDGSFTFNGTATGELYFSINSANLDAGTYTLSGGFSGGSWSKYVLYCSNDAGWATFGGASTFKWGGGTANFNFVIYTGTTVSNLTIYPMINKGDTALPYEPYFEGLQDAKVMAVESVGANLIPYPYKNTTRTDNGITYTVNNDGSITINGTCTATNGYSQFTLFEWLMPEYEHENLTFSMLNSAVGGLYAVIGGTGYSYAETATTATINRLAGANNIVQYGYIRVRQNRTISNVTVYPMLNKGETALPYALYREKEIFPIPEAVQALEGYGQGVSKEYHNKIVLDSASGVKRFVRNVGAVDMGKQSYAYHSASNVFSTDVPIKANYTAEFLLNDYIKTDVIDLTSLPNMSARFGSTGMTLWLKNTLYTNVEDFKASMQGVMLLYALATPVEIDISDYFGDDNLIGVEGGGTVTMVNEYEYEVPSVIEYTVKGSEAT